MGDFREGVHIDVPADDVCIRVGHASDAMRGATGLPSGSRVPKCRREKGVPVARGTCPIGRVRARVRYLSKCRCAPHPARAAATRNDGAGACVPAAVINEGLISWGTKCLKPRRWAAGASGVYKPSYVVISQQNICKLLIYKEPILLALFYWLFNW